jgi:hypothetical protein
MNWIKTFAIVNMLGIDPDHIDSVVNKWVEENQVTVVSTSVSYSPGMVIVVLLYRDPNVGAAS